jgi:hypothetical protein
MACHVVIEERDIKTGEERLLFPCMGHTEMTETFTGTTGAN